MQMRYRPSSLGDYSKLGWDASYRGATWTSECSEASVRKNTYSTSAAESTEYNFKHTPGVGAHVGKVHTGIPRCTRHKGAHSGSYCPEYKQTPERGQVQGYWSLTGSLLAISTELREAVLCHAVTLCCTLRYKMMPLTD